MNFYKYQIIELDRSLDEMSTITNQTIVKHHSSRHSIVENEMRKKNAHKTGHTFNFYFSAKKKIEEEKIDNFFSLYITLIQNDERVSIDKGSTISNLFASHWANARARARVIDGDLAIFFSQISKCQKKRVREIEFFFFVVFFSFTTLIIDFGKEWHKIIVFDSILLNDY